MKINSCLSNDQNAVNSSTAMKDQKQMVLDHLDNNNTCATLLFIIYNTMLNTIITSKLIVKLRDLGHCFYTYV